MTQRELNQQALEEGYCRRVGEAPASWQSTVRYPNWLNVERVLFLLADTYHLELTVLGEQKGWMHTMLAFRFAGQESAVRACRRELLGMFEG